MSEDKGVGLQEMFSEKLSLSPIRSHLSQHVVPPSLYCSRNECKEMTSIFEQSSEHNSCAGCLAWLWLGTMILLIAAGFWMIIRCCLKLRKSRNIQRKGKPPSSSHIVFFSTNDLNDKKSKLNDRSYIINEHVFCKYEPNWKSLDSRPNPPWYDEAKFGIFMHWGVYSVPSFGSEWFWKNWHDGDAAYVNFMKENYPPGFEYADFAPLFRAEMFDPDAWADLLAKSGAKYLVLTSKHHEGFTNWGSNVSWNWNSEDVGPHRNLIGDLAKSIRARTNITFGLYHSLFEWFNPLYLEDKANGFKTRNYVTNVLKPELYDMINQFKPEYVWSDGDWEAADTYWGSTEFLAWLYNESPVKDTVVVNDRWGVGCMCHHGGSYTCADRYNPGVLQKHKWENAMTVDKKSWGFRREAKLEDFLTIQDLISILAETVSCGGNLLMNVGPTHDGRIVPIFQERLTQMGDWLGVNGEAIYASKPWRVQNDTKTAGIWYTSKDNVAYAIVLQWPADNTLQLMAPLADPAMTKVTMLGLSVDIEWKQGAGGKGVVVEMPRVTVTKLPSDWAWVLKLQNVH